jgi:hypothetical protein
MEIRNAYIDCKYFEQKSELIKELNKAQYSIELVDNFDACDLYIAFDKINRTVLNSLSEHVFKVLVRQEPRIVLMETYTKDNTEQFDHVIDVGKVKNSENSVINWPQDLSKDFSNVKNRSEKIAVINSNLLSLAKGENYSLRRQIALEIHEIDLYGYQWNNGFRSKVSILIKEFRKYAFKVNNIKFCGLKHFFRFFNNYLGEVKDKREILSNYKYSIVIENSSDYLSEKLFDVMFSGCIPIYIGPNLTNYEIPDYLYIQAKPEISDIKEKILYAKSKDYNEWLDKLKIWSMDPKTYNNWSKDLFVSKIFSNIENLYQ